MFVTVLGHDADVRSILAQSLQSLGILHSVYPAADSDLLKADRVKAGTRQHLVLIQVSPESRNYSAISRLLKLGDSQLRIVGVGAGLTSDDLLELVRAGAVDYLNIGHDVTAQLGKLLCRIRSSQPETPQAPCFLPVFAPSGGCGATFITANLACALATMDLRVCALDLKPCGGDMAALLKLTPRHTFESLARKGDDIDVTMLEECLLQHECGVHLLASPEPFTDDAHGSTMHLKRIVQTAGRKFTHLLYEIEGGLFQQTVDLLSIGERIIIPLRMDFISVYRARRYLDFLARAGISQDRALLVACRTGRPKDLLVEKVEQVLGMTVNHEIPECPELANASVNIGTPVTLSHPESPLSRQIFRLAQTLAHRQFDTPQDASSSTWWSSMRSLASIFGSRAG